MNVYLRRLLAHPKTTSADRARARMLAERTNPMALVSMARLRWMALVAQQIAERATKERLRDLEKRIEALEEDNTYNRTVVAQVADQVGTLGRMARATTRGPGWWRKDPRIEAFLRRSVVELRDQGVSDVQILKEVFIGLSVADLRQLCTAA